MNCNQNTVNLCLKNTQNSSLIAAKQILLCQAKKGHSTMPSKHDYVHFSVLQCTTHCCTANKTRDGHSQSSAPLRKTGI